MAVAFAAAAATRRRSQAGAGPAAKPGDGRGGAAATAAAPGQEAWRSPSGEVRGPSAGGASPKMAQARGKRVPHVD